MRYVATIGFFDGVHLGHRFLLDNLKKTACAEGLGAAVVTFASHPKLTLQGSSPLLLTTYEERIDRLKAVGVDEIFCFDFSVVRDMTAQEFMTLLHERCDVDLLLMGYDHRFGSDGITDLHDYQRLGAAIGMGVKQIVCADIGDVSSTKIRCALREGRVEDANRMLGYSYALIGKVVHGRGLGAQLGFPTANIDIPADKLIPRSGVYKAHVAEHEAILNIGTNPTVNGDRLTIEVHLIDCHIDLYDQTISVSLLHYLREDKKFATLDELKRQIQQDIIS